MATTAGDDAPDQEATRPLGVYQVPRETMERLEALQHAIRDANFKPPGKGLLLSALIYSAYMSGPDGQQLETEIMSPYRRDHPGEDLPRA